ncbi:MAG: DUF2079 domain-containing protein [bacterium]
MNKTENIKKFLNKYAAIILMAAILFYIIIFFGISCFKYNNFYYNSLDLAIFNQVFYNTSHGRLFQLSIHEPTYLGDHFAPIILFLAPLYSFYRSPIALLFLQTVILALSAWPIYLISKKIIGGKIYPLAMGAVWLINPLVQNANLFEFHLLPFAVFLFLWVFYFYLQKKWRMFFLFVFLSLLVREDVSLVIFMFGVLLAADWVVAFKKTKKQENKKTRKQKNSEIASLIRGVGGFDGLKENAENTHSAGSGQATTRKHDYKELFFGIILCLISAVWLIISLKIISIYAPAGRYKFLFYYSWLGNSLSEIIINIFIHPIIVLRHFITIYNIEMILGLLFSFCFLPLFSKKYLILLLGPLFQLMIGGPGGSALVLQTHYCLLLLPALAISFICGFKRFLREQLGKNSKTPIIKILANEKKLLIIIFVFGLVYSSLTLGPLVGVASGIIKNPPNKTIVNIKNDFLAEIPKNSSVATTYEYLNNLSSRQKVYSMHYAFIGKKQYAEADYELPNGIEYLLIDFHDFFIYNVQFPSLLVYKNFFNLADDNMRNLFEHYKLVKIFDNQALFKLSKKIEQTDLYQITDKRPKYENNVDLGDKIKFIGWEILERKPTLEKFADQLFPISIFFQAKSSLASDDPKEPSKNYQLKMMITNNKNEVLYEKFYPLGYGIFPTSEWPLEKNAQINYWFYIPEEFSGDENIIQFNLTQVSGHMELNSFRQAELKYEEEALKPSIVIDKIKNLK